MFLRKFLTYSFVTLLPVSGFCDVTITRDLFGVPTISGGNLAEVSRAVGKVHAEDRLWQIFLQNIVANGRATQYLGASNPVLLQSDIFQREINPTDEEVQEQIEKYFTHHTLTAFENYVRGLNDTVEIVNSNPLLRPYELVAVLGFDPIPYFTLEDNIRSARLFLQSFSPTQIPTFQLDNLIALQTLAGGFGATAAYAILEDVDPTTSQVRSEITIVPNNNATPRSLDDILLAKSQSKDFTPIDLDSLNAIQNIADNIRSIKDLHMTMIPSLGSNGQVIGPNLSASGNPLLRCAIQPNFNHPSDFYQVIVEDSFFSGNYFIVPGVPFGPGTFNHFGITLQTGQLPTNDFLFELVYNVSSSREEVIHVKNDSDVVITVYRSSSGGWVIENPFSNNAPLTMLTLRSAFIDRQLQGLNIIGDLPFINSVPEFFRKALKASHVSDIIGFEGQCADCEGNFGAFQATYWTHLPSTYDRRLPQGIPFPAPSNTLYDFEESARLPMYDINNPQGYYSGWNNPFKQFAEGSADTTTGISLSRAYWLVNYLNSFDTISFDDLANTTFEQALANSIVAFKSSRPTAFADLFTPLFKERFFQAINGQANPTSDQLAALALLADFEGNWFEGNASQVAVTNDVSDKFILASAWLLNVAAEILNPYLNGTKFEVNAGSAGVLNSLPSTNGLGASNDLATYQGNLLARILGLSTDNTLIFPYWLVSVDVDQAIINGLNTAISNLGGFGARPWGAGLRQTYQFKNAVMGTVATAKMFNASGLYFVTEFGPHGIVRTQSTLPLGESGFAAFDSNQPLVPVFGSHNFDQLPYWETFQLKPE